MRLLHQDYMEFGRSGKSYTKDDVIARLTLEDHSVKSTFAIWSQDFVLATLSCNVALLTYKSASVEGNPRLSNYTLRSSIWEHISSRWQIRFHQGTATKPFPKTG
jgi:hypothetical protein